MSQGHEKTTLKQLCQLTSEVKHPLKMVWIWETHFYGWAALGSIMDKSSLVNFTHSQTLSSFSSDQSRCWACAHNEIRKKQFWRQRKPTCREAFDEIAALTGEELWTWCCLIVPRSPCSCEGDTGVWYPHRLPQTREWRSNLLQRGDSPLGILSFPLLGSFQWTHVVPHFGKGNVWPSWKGMKRYVVIWSPRLGFLCLLCWGSALAYSGRIADASQPVPLSQGLSSVLFSTPADLVFPSALLVPAVIPPTTRRAAGFARVCIRLLLSLPCHTEQGLRELEESEIRP